MDFLHIPKKNKFQAKRTNGMASKLEASVFQILLLRQRAGEITNIKQQQTVKLTLANISARIDFSFVDKKTGQLIYCEAKGKSLDRWNIIKRLWKFYGPGKLEIWKGSYKKPKLDEVIAPT